MNGPDLELQNQHLVELAISKLNAFHDDGYAFINQIQRYFPSCRPTTEYHEFYQRIAKGDLVWVRDFRDTFIGHVPKSYAELNEAVPRANQLQMLNELDAIYEMLSRCLNEIEGQLTAAERALSRKVHNAENLRAALKWDGDVLNKIPPEAVRILLAEGVLIPKATT